MVGAGVWPEVASPEDALLEAALFPDRAGVRWETWSASHPLDDVAEHQFALLPLVYANLAAENIEGRDMGRLRGIYRRSWYASQLGLDGLARLAGHLAVESAVIGDAAVLRWGRLEIGHLSLDLPRLLIPATTAGDVVDRLAGVGWRPIGGDTDIALRRSIVLVDEGGQQVALEWVFGDRHPIEGASQLVWRDASFGWDLYPGVQTVSAETQLMDTMLQGLESARHRLRWIADAAALIRSVSIDWTRFLALAQQAGQGVVAARGLNSLHARLPGHVPEVVVDGLGDGTRRERLELWFRARTTRRYPWRSLPAAWFRHRQLSLVRGSRPNPLGFVKRVVRGRIRGAS